jgi:hypothetical protein
MGDLEPESILGADGEAQRHARRYCGGTFRCPTLGPLAARCLHVYCQARVLAVAARPAQVGVLLRSGRVPDCLGRVAIGV